MNVKIVKFQLGKLWDHLNLFLECQIHSVFLFCGTMPCNFSMTLSPEVVAPTSSCCSHVINLTLPGHLLAAVRCQLISWSNYVVNSRADVFQAEAWLPVDSDLGNGIGEARKSTDNCQLLLARLCDIAVARENAVCGTPLSHSCSSAGVSSCGWHRPTTVQWESARLEPSLQLVPSVQWTHGPSVPLSASRVITESTSSMKS